MCAKRMAILLCIFTMVLICTRPIFAASITDNIEPLGHLKVAAAAEYNYVFDRELDGEIENGASPGTFSSGEIDKEYQAYAKIILGFTQYLNIYGKIGVTDMKLLLKESDGTRYDIETDNTALYGGGISGSIEVAGGINLAADLQFLAASFDVDKVTYLGEIATSPNGTVDTYEFQTAIVASKKFENIDTLGMSLKSLTPYFGAIGTIYKINTDGEIKFTTPGGGSIMAGLDLDNDTRFGIVGGLNIALADAVSANLESRFIDETAFTGGLTYKF